MRIDLPGRDVALWTETSGDGAPLLLIGGMGTHLGHWRHRFLARLGARKLIRYEPRGINRSTTVRGPFTVVDLADDAAALLSALDVARADVLGFSLGGMVAQELALRHPAATGRIMLVGTGAGGPPDPIPADVWDRLWGALRGGNAARAIETTWTLSVSASFAADSSYDEWEHAALGGVVRPRVVAWQHAAVLGHRAANRVSALGGRATVLHGTEDRVIPPDRAEQLASALGDTTVRWLEGTGHACCWQAPEQVASMVRDALGESGQRP